MKTTTKKMLSLLCLGMLASTVGNTLASAEVIDNGNGTLTIDNSNGTSDSSASVKVSGQVGFDNTNPKSPDPKDPKWYSHQLKPQDLKILKGMRVN
jgi:hypothetical protein